jgi:hypothetical protein
VDLKVPITITDELTDQVLHFAGALNLASGEIHPVEYIDYDSQTQGFPYESEEYEFTRGALSKKRQGRGIQGRGVQGDGAVLGERQRAAGDQGARRGAVCRGHEQTAGRGRRRAQRAGARSQAALSGRMLSAA